MTNKSLTISLVVVAIVAIIGLFLPATKSLIGSVSTSCNSFTSCLSDLYVTTKFGGSGSIQTDGTLTVGGKTTITTSNTATSTLVVGCIQMYATSTATAVHLEFSTTTTLAAYSTSKIGHAVAWRYGSCPI